jgi:hypothetical protein
MIKKWNNFIKESVDHDWDYYYNNIKKMLEKIIETPDSEYVNGVSGKKSDLLSIFQNYLKLEDNISINNHIIKSMHLYTEYVYNKTSREIKEFLIKSFGESDKWTDHVLILNRKNPKDISEIIIKILDIYSKIKNDFEDNGYPKKQKISEEIEYVCINSIDDDILKLYDVCENSENVYIELGYDKDNLNIELLQKITDEVYSICGRIKDVTGLKNIFVKFGNNLLVGFKF